jgi:hypothetical protein
VLIDGTSEILKPGMTTSNQILIKEVPDTIFIPQEAVFEKEGKFIVYLKDGSSYDEVEVTLGDKSEDHIIVKNGLNPGDIVALSDPYSDDKVNQNPLQKKIMVFKCQMRVSSMKSMETVKISLSELRSNKLRTFLTMLGIVFGVASVIAMLIYWRRSSPGNY